MQISATTHTQKKNKKKRDSNLKEKTVREKSLHSCSLSPTNTMNNPKVNIKKKVAPHFRISNKKLQCNPRERERSEVQSEVNARNPFSLTIEFRHERERERDGIATCQAYYQG